MGAMHDVRKHLAIHLFHLRPIGAMHVRHVEITPLIAPSLVEDLFEFLAWVEIHAQSRVQATLARLWRSAMSTDDEKRRSRRPTRGACSGTPAATTTACSCAIEELV